MNIEQYKKLQMEVARKAHDLEMAKSALQNAEQDLRSQVVVSKVGGTVTVAFGERVLKCVKNSHNRYRITENKKVIDSDYLGSINDLRLALATM